MNAANGYDEALDLVTDVPVALRPKGYQLSGVRMAEVGAAMAAAGYEANEVGGFMETVTLAVQSTFMTMLPDIMAKLTAIQKARINRIMQSIRALPDYSLVTQASILQRISGVAQTPPLKLISADAVLQILAAAAEEPPRP